MKYKRRFIEDNLKEIEKVNYEHFKETSEYYKKIIKNFLKSIPKTTLIQLLKELKIIKVDYVTNQITELKRSKK